MERRSDAKPGVWVLLVLFALLVAIFVWMRTRDEKPNPNGATAAASQGANPGAMELPAGGPPGVSARSASPPGEFVPPTATRRDKEYREQARLRLLKTLPPEPARDPAGAPTAPPSPPPTLDKDYIQSRIREDFL